MSHGRPPRKLRWKPTAATMTIAQRGAAKPDPQHINTVTHLLQSSFAALRQGKATELQFSILKGACSTAKAVEKQGVVTGLMDIILVADKTLDTIWARIVKDGSWGTTALHAYELDYVREFVQLHCWQVRQLARGEYLRAVESARGSIGPTAQVLHGSQATHEVAAS